MELNELTPMSNILRATGKLNIVLADALGNIKYEVNTHNMVVTSGLNHIAARFKNAGTSAGVGAEMSHMAIGTGTTAPSLGDTGLGTPNGARQALTSFTTSGASATFVSTFASGYSGAITEAGVFNALTSGTMLCRSTFLEINKATDDTLTITWIVTLS